MEKIEWFALGNRKCDCRDVRLIASKRILSVKRPIPLRGRNPSIWAQIFRETKTVTETRYIIRCSQCEVLYFVYSAKKKLASDFKKFGIPYQLQED